MKRALRHVPRDERESELFELMYERAMLGLDEPRQREFESRAAQHPDLDIDCYERAAAALWLHHSGGRCAALPESLRARIVAQAPAAAAQARVAPRGAWLQWSGWIAAAALLALWLGLPVRAPGTRDGLAARAELLSADPAARTVAWTRTEDPDGRGVAGDIVWSGGLQQGWMRFTGLPANDPAQRQYQLWIFDAQRPSETPVDGGVFDIPAGGEAVVAVQPKLKVGAAALFAVTVEAPGGVVVSKREHIVALAQL